MRRKDKELTNQNEIQSIIKKECVLRMAMYDEEAKEPYIVPLTYGYKDNFFYFHSANQGRKVNVLTKNSKVSFVIEEAAELVHGEIACRFTMKYKCVMGFGNVELVLDEAERQVGLDSIMNQCLKANDTYAYNERFKHTAIYKIIVNKLTAKQSPID